MHEYHIEIGPRLLRLVQDTLLGAVSAFLLVLAVVAWHLGDFLGIIEEALR